MKDNATELLTSALVKQFNLINDSPASHLFMLDPCRQAVGKMVLVHRCPDGQARERDQVEDVQQHVDQQNLRHRLEKGKVKKL